MKYKLLLLLLIIVGAYLRFSYLDWGEGYYFHPDERNIAQAVSQLSFPDDLNPDFFAYGSYPLYKTYLLGGFKDLTSAIMVSRFMSALLSTALIPLIYIVFSYIFSKNLALFAATVTTFLPGFIQFAHFGTFEMYLTFLYTLALLAALRALRSPSVVCYLILGVIIGLAVGTKIVSLYLLGLPFLLSFLENHSFSIRTIFNRKTSISILAAVFIFFITNPYIFLDYPAFLSSLTYESSVAQGTLPVFYTRGFIETIPALFQLKNILPYISGPVIFFFSVLGILLLSVDTLRFSNSNRKQFVVLLFVFGGYTLFHLGMYVKWTRYMIPALPLLVTGITYLVKQIYLCVEQKTFHKGLPAFVQSLLILSVIFSGVSFFSIYRQLDPRVAAAKWAENTISQEAQILSEAYDLGVLPFNYNFGTRITLFDFYELDNNSTEYTIPALAQQLTLSDYVLIPSRRVYGNSLRLPERFPNSAAYYKNLFEGKLGFSQVYEAQREPCLITRLCPLSNSLAEETFMVFDHPRVLIFEKQNPLTQEQYVQILSE